MRLSSGLTPMHGRRAGSLITCVALTLLAFGGCKGEPTDESAGDGDGTDATGTTTAGTGDGDGDGDGDDSSDCPLGSFDCPCNDGVCDAGLTCGADDLCSLGGDPTGNPTTGDPTTTTTTTTTGGPGNPYDPDECEAPSELIHVELLEGTFCSAPCMEDSECPDGPPGTDPLCTISTNGVEPTNCALLCTPGEETCPTGSTCEQIPQQPGFGLCTY